MPSRSASPPGRPGSPCTRAPTQRHITAADVREIAAALAPLRGRSSSTSKAIRGPTCSSWSTRSCPDQCTLVPVLPGEITSQAGWPADTPPAALRGGHLADLRAAGIRVSLFVDPDRRRRSAGRRRWAPTGSSSTPSRSRARSRRAARRRGAASRATPPPPRLAHAARPGRQRRPRPRPRQPGAVPNAAASRRSLDRPRPHQPRAVRRPRHAPSASTWPPSRGTLIFSVSC